MRESVALQSSRRVLASYSVLIQISQARTAAMSNRFQSRLGIPDVVVGRHRVIGCRTKAEED